MTQEEKAKAYDIALARAREIHHNEDDKVKDMEFLFPELKESEDERIRKALKEYFINSFQNNGVAAICGVHIIDILAWLEKQGGQKVSCTTLVETGNGGINALVTRELPINGCDEQKSADKVEPKFHEGEWVVQGYNILKIKCVGDTHYCFETVGGYVDDMLVSEIDSLYHLWTIQDAKDGDVLCYETENELRIFIYKNGHIHYHCHYCNEHLTTVDSFFVVEKYLLCYVHPATREQRDLLFQKMREAGYEWDAERKELKKSNSYCQEHCKDKREAERKSDWSEDDECKMNMCITAVEACYYKWDSMVYWLKSLKQRIEG